MHKTLFSVLTLTALLCGAATNAQINAALLRYPDVSATDIVFTYANDLWVVPKTGGVAHHLSSPSGVEAWPKFSPDGNTIAFTADYDGSYSIYTIPTTGGIPNRLTWYGTPERVADWYPDGKSILFASGRESGRDRFNQFYKIPATGGAPEKLPLPFAEYGTLSPDATHLAFTFTSQVGRNWKRYRGGWRGQIHIFDLINYADEDISTTNADDELPMWHDHSVYFLSDRGEDKRMNLWEYDFGAKTFTERTHFTDYDANYASQGPDDIVFEEAGHLWLYTYATRDAKQVPVQVVSDETGLRPKLQTVDHLIAGANISPDGKRAVLEARGDIYTVPAEDGPVYDLTNTSGIAERSPAWSPDGKYIAYWSDRSGEYELTLREPGQPNSEKKLTSYGPGFRYNLFWSPDSKKLAFIDKAMKIFIYDRISGQTTTVDQGVRMTEGALEGFSPSWSPDSRFLAYDRDIPNNHRAIYIYDVDEHELHPVTSGYYSCSNPAFDSYGKYLYVTTSQAFNPLYSDMDNTFIYPNSTELAAIVLKKNTRSPLYTKDDTVAVNETPESTEPPKPPAPPAKPAATPVKPAVPPVAIDFEGLESRLIILPEQPGNYNNLHSAGGRLFYLQQPNTGSAQHNQTLKFFDFDQRKSRTVLNDVDGYQLAADGKHLLAVKDDNYYIVAADEGQKLDKKLRTNEMQQWVNPREEWRQILVDAWRFERDFFYDPNMHGVDWNKVKEQYLKMLAGASTREEVDFILGEMIGELSSSHTYHGGGVTQPTLHVPTGYLGINWAAEGDYYKVAGIIRGASWDAERSPLDLPGVPIRKGDYILAVNGIPIRTTTDPYAAFENLSNKPVELTYNTTPSMTGAKTVVVRTMSNESELRHLAWIEQKRETVEKETGGNVGYIYVSSTGIDGQNELIRQFVAQFDKKALIIDERFNSGGQIPDRFIEVLNRKPLAFWATRDGIPAQTPPAANFGPKVMLINGWSGSGGDAFPDYFRKAGLGPLIGTRTWGGLIGISGAPGLIDGGVITVPTFRMYNPDGTWFKEGHGVDPDIRVPEDLTAAAHGIDNQLERAITEINELLKKGFTPPNRPAPEVR
ncbi:MAG TPA: PDZ domain-containing protein [Puia sp.]|nr:PDZ domain-containing protein [Puia sp.]